MGRHQNGYRRLLILWTFVFAVFQWNAPDSLAAERYTYTVTFSTGNQGSFSGTEHVMVTDSGGSVRSVPMDNSGSVIAVNNLEQGDRVTFDTSMDGAVALDNNKYYVRGIRRSGRDNNTVGNASFEVESDADYVVAYGIRGDGTSYTVYFQDESGNELSPSRTYYGNVGDKPVVAFLYIEGYEPQAYNLTKTLSANEAENVFTFVYREVETERIVTEGTTNVIEETTVIQEPGTTTVTERPGTTTVTETPGTTTTTVNPGTTTVIQGNGTTAGGETTGGNNANDADAADGADNADADADDGTGGESNLTNIQDEQTPRNVVDLDDDPTPLSNLELDEGGEEEGSRWRSLSKALIVLGAGAIAGIIFIIAWRKKRSEEEDLELALAELAEEESALEMDFAELAEGRSALEMDFAELAEGRSASEVDFAELAEEEPASEMDLEELAEEEKTE